MSNTRASLAFASALLFSISLSATAVSAQTVRERTLTVVGSGEVHAVPDTALVSAAVATDADTASTALRQNSTAVAKVLDMIRASGIEARDVQTSGLSVEPRYSRVERTGAPDRSRVIGYTATNGFTVRVRDLGKLGRLLDDLAAAGVNRMHGIQFLLADPQKVLDEARRRAIEDAKNRANLYAQTAGIAVGKIHSLAEESVSLPRPMARSFETPAAAVPVASGEITVSAQIRVSWDLTN